MNILNKILLVLVLSSIFIGCNNNSHNKEDLSSDISSLYIETVNFTPELKLCFDNNFFNNPDTDTLWTAPYKTIYRFNDASVLPDKNLLDYTKKMRITLLKNDSVGNPVFSVEVLHTENSKWVRTSNSGRNPVYADSLLSAEQICEYITNSVKVYILKFNP